MEKNTINTTIFHKPNGRKELIELKHIYKDDADYINNKDIKVSMEECDQNFILYFDYGKKDNENEPVEHIEISAGRSCEDTIKCAVEKIQKDDIICN